MCLLVVTFGSGAVVWHVHQACLASIIEGLLSNCRERKKAQHEGHDAHHGQQDEAAVACLHGRAGVFCVVVVVAWCLWIVQYGVCWGESRRREAAI